MKILHTSDWHLGRSLNGRKRYEEQEAFLDWLAETIDREGIDALLVAGDLFDASTPSNRAQELYYRFMCRVASSPCRHVVVIGGNHDSPSFLDAPKELLKSLNVHVVGSITDNPDDEVIALADARGATELVVCAVPYLRDRDIRSAEAGESIEDKERKLVEGIRNHYAEVTRSAESKRAEAGGNIPLVAMGHLFTAGGLTVAEDGVRELYVGSLAHVRADNLPASPDYFALGHLHVPQTVGGSDYIRYSGSPIPMGFGEINHAKSVVIVDFSDGIPPRISEIPAPLFQRMERVRGDWSQIEARLRELAAAGVSIWLEVVYESDEIMGDLRQRVMERVENTCLEALNVKNPRAIEKALEQSQCHESLEELDEYQVFERLLSSRKAPEEQRSALIHTYREAVQSLYDDDANAE